MNSMTPTMIGRDQPLCTCSAEGEHRLSDHDDRIREQVSAGVQGSTPTPGACIAQDDGSVAANLRAARMRLGMTLDDAAGATGIGRDRISRLETGRRRMDVPTLMRLARAYGVSAGRMLDEASGDAVRELAADAGTTDEPLRDRHPGTQQIMQWFAYEHLADGPIRGASKACADLAEEYLDCIPDGPELTAGLRKLLEAKDCFVRAAIAAMRQANGN